MSKKRRFVEVLSMKQNEDEYWYEYGMDEAIDLGNGLTEKEWALVCQDWQSLTPLAQECLAQIASDIEIRDVETIDLLLSMLGSDLKGVVDMSIDSLYAIAQVNPERVNNDKVKAAISSVKVRGAAVSLILKNLRAILNSLS